MAEGPKLGAQIVDGLQSDDRADTRMDTAEIQDTGRGGTAQTGSDGSPFGALTIDRLPRALLLFRPSRQLWPWNKQ
jgi:hypothetical protein